MTLTISRAIHAELLALAASEPDREVCGLLFGEVDRVESYEPCVNVSPSPHDSFEIEPAALIRAHKATRADGPSLIGCYHSHPNGAGELSVRDMSEGWGGCSLWIVLPGNAVYGWRIDEHSYAPVRVELEIV